jgi:hypothetical protein
MNTDPLPEDLERLRRLLALKRHETPPPGYFRTFSQQVIQRIEAEEQASASSGWRSWFNRFPSANVWLNPNAWIASGLALLAITAVFLGKNPPKPGEASSVPKAAGLGFNAQSPTPQPLSVDERFQLPAGLGYRIEIITFDSNSVPHSLLLQPVYPTEAVHWPR